MTERPVYHATATWGGSARKGYAVTIHGLPEKMAGATQGSTWEEALSMTREAIALLLDVGEDTFDVVLTEGERMFVVCTTWTVKRPGEPRKLRRMSVHAKGCAHIPLSHHNKLRTGDGVRDDITQADSHGVVPAISCRGCGGWPVT